MNLFLQISKHSDVQILKILTLLTLKSSQSSVTLKNECKQLCYYFPNEIKNSSYSNKKILKLKQQGKIKTIQKNIFINCPRGKLPSTHNPKTKPNPNPNFSKQFFLGTIVWLPPALKLTLTLTETPTLTGGQFSSGGNCPDTVQQNVNMHLKGKT